MINIELTDLLVFEDEAGNIYQDCVCEITNFEQNNFRFTDINRYRRIKGHISFVIINLDEDRISQTACLNCKKQPTLKEIWHKVDEDTYKKIWSK